MISFMKGSGKNILARPNSKNANRMPHHHLNIFLMGIFLLIFLRLLKMPLPAAGRQMQVELCEIPFAGAPEILS